MNNCLLKETEIVNFYESPVCRVISVGTNRVICGSETEIVGEDEGEW